MGAEHSQANRTTVNVSLGEVGQLVGSLVYVRQGRREHSAFAYEQTWLQNPLRFSFSADLQLLPGFQSHKAKAPQDSVFHGAIADTAPDAWGRRVIARDHARRRKAAPELPALTELDYLLAVDDFSRIGALRLQIPGESCEQASGSGRRATLPFIDLDRIYQASRAVERGNETDEDLRFLRGKGTSLGGMRPKCTLLDEAGHLSIGKFPSINDDRSVTRGEVLALKLAARAGIDAATARVVMLAETPIAVIRRFDRDTAGGRIPYQSAATLLQAARGEDRSYLEIVDAIRTHGDNPEGDVRQLWRRLVFNLLITNVDDHLQNHGFLHVSSGHWRLAPCFDINPFPDKDRESKTWLSEKDGPITDLAMLLERAPYFALERAQALHILSEVYAAVAAWRRVATGVEVGMRTNELPHFQAAFEHTQMHDAAQFIGL